MVDSKYFKEWYRHKGGALNADRRLRYENDPAYRARVLKQNTESRDRRRQEERGERAAAADAVVVRASRTPWKEVTDPQKGVMFTISALARSLGVPVQTIRSWERKGVIQAPETRSPKGDRLYALTDVEKIRTLLLKKGRITNTPIRAKEPPAPVLRRIEFSDGTQGMCRLFRVSLLAEAMGRTVVTIEQYERNGRFPYTPFRGGTGQNAGYRLYTLPMIEAACEALQAAGGEIRGAAAWQQFHDAVRQAWDQQKVIGARLLPET